MDPVSYNDFKRLDLRIGVIKSVEPIPGSTKLFKLIVDLGTSSTTLAAGLAEHYTADELNGKQVVVVVNLEPRTIKGVDSNGMLLAAEDGKVVALLTPDKSVGAGAQVL